MRQIRRTLSAIPWKDALRRTLMPIAVILSLLMSSPALRGFSG
jgi:hypothetical protein